MSQYTQKQALAWADAVQRGDWETANRISGKQNLEQGMYQRTPKKSKLKFWSNKGKQKYHLRGGKYAQQKNVEAILRSEGVDTIPRRYQNIAHENRGGQRLKKMGIDTVQRRKKRKKSKHKKRTGKQKYHFSDIRQPANLTKDEKERLYAKDMEAVVDRYGNPPYLIAPMSKYDEEYGEPENVRRWRTIRRFTDPHVYEGAYRRPKKKSKVKFWSHKKMGKQEYTRSITSYSQEELERELDHLRERQKRRIKQDSKSYKKLIDKLGIDDDKLSW